jgi:hypothetical protein
MAVTPPTAPPSPKRTERMEPVITWTPEQRHAAALRAGKAELQVWTDIAAQLLVFYGYIPDELLPLAKKMTARRLGLPPVDANT